MKKIIKNNLKTIIAFIIGIVIAGTTVYAAAPLFYSTDVGYDNSNGMAATTVQGAIDELYNLANNKECKSGYIKRNETSSGYECALPKCIRAETLHTSNGKTWGTLGSGDTIAAGDAFDCDVNGDGNYSERFYYVSDYYNTKEKKFKDDTAVLIYYSNVAAGVPSNSAKFGYYMTAKENWHGPVTALAQLPTTTQWSNVGLKNTARQILTQTGTTSTDGGALPVFSYAGYAARLLTTQELESACGITVGSYTTGELDTCAYLMENTKYDSSSIDNKGYWLESPYAFYPNNAWAVYAHDSHVDAGYVNNGTFGLGVRPVIEVPYSDIAK